MKDASGLKTFLIIMLVVSGLPSALAIAYPTAVELGFYFLVLPGLVLMLAPTVFLILAVFTLVWWIVSKGKEGKAGILAGLVAVLTIIILPPLFDGFRAKAALARVRQASVLPSGPVTLAGDVWLKLPTTSDYAEANSCSGLCMDLLDRPSVTAVTQELTKRGSASQSSRYRLLDSTAACEQAKTDPTKVIITPTRMTAGIAEGDNNSVYQSRKALFETSSACIVREASLAAAGDHTIELDDNPMFTSGTNWSLFGNLQIEQQTLTIRDKSGTVQFFAGTWTTSSLAMPLRTVYDRNDGKPALGWDYTFRRVGETNRSVPTLLYLAIFGKQLEPPKNQFPVTKGPAPIQP